MKLMTHKIIAWSLCLLLLIGVTASGYSDILCISEDGVHEFETVCLPCCTDDAENCNFESSGDRQDEHNNCSDCSDVEIDNPLWSKRIQKISSKQLLISKHNPLVKSTYGLPAVNKSSINLISLNQHPPLISLSSVIIIC